MRRLFIFLTIGSLLLGVAIVFWGTRAQLPGAAGTRPSTGTPPATSHAVLPAVVVVTAIRPTGADTRPSGAATVFMEWGLRRRTLERLRLLPGARRIASMRWIRGRATVNDRAADVCIAGITPDYLVLTGGTRQAGRLLDSSDAERASAVCVLTPRAVGVLAAAGEPTLIGRDLRIGQGRATMTVSVVGAVANVGSESGNAADPPADVFVPLSYMLEAFGEVQVRGVDYERIELNEIVVEVAAGEEPDVALAAVRAVIESEPEGTTRISLRKAQ